MTGYPRSMSEHGPCRSLAAYKLALVAEHYTLLLAQLEAENSGCDTVAAHHARRIARIDARLREIDAAEKS